MIDNQDVILEFQDSLNSANFSGCLQKIIKINYKLNPEVHGKNNFVKDAILRYEHKHHEHLKKNPVEEVLIVDKNGATQIKKVDKLKNDNDCNIIKIFKDKSKCIDMFQKFELYGQKIYEG